MPANELEIHPYLEDINYQDFKVNHFENLIIGTFPVYGITNTLTPDGAIQEHAFNENDAYMRFFYGSKKNYFWQLLANAFNANNPLELANPKARKQAAIQLLDKNKFLITDVVHKTNRKNQSASDNDLWANTNNQFVLNNRCLNHGIINLLDNNKAIKNLYFTATGLEGKNPFGWFNNIFGNQLIYEQINVFHNRPVSATLYIKKQKYTAFFLITPSGNWARRIAFTGLNNDGMFSNYLNSINQEFYNTIAEIPKDDRTTEQNNRLTELRKAFLRVYYRELLQNKNAHFNGVVN